MAPSSQPLMPLAAWPRSAQVPGLYESWEGYAWVELQRALAGRFEPSPRWLESLERRLRLQLSQPPGPYCGELVGETALLSLCVLGARVAPERFASLLPSAEARVEHILATATHLDLMTGLCGTFVGIVQLRKTYYPRRLLRALHGRIASKVRGQLVARAPLRLGLAHGLAGYLLALELGRSVCGFGDKQDVIARGLEHLLSAPFLDERGQVWWPIDSGGAAPAGGFLNAWCHGNAGIALAAFVCRAMSRRDDYQSLHRAASATLLATGPLRTFCCGSVGLAQIALEMMRGCRGGARRRYSDMLQVLLPRVEAGAPLPPGARGLFKGPLGELYLRERLAAPAHLPLPALGV